MWEAVASIIWGSVGIYLGIYLRAVSHRSNGGFAYSRVIETPFAHHILCRSYVTRDARLKGNGLTANNNPAAV